MFLALTADQRYWKKDEKILFLGEWCKLYKEKNTWSQLDYEVMPYHWDDRERFHRDWEYIDQVYEKYLRLFADRLNTIHGVNYSLRYWRILIGLWLRGLIDSTYDRYLSIKAAQQLDEKLYTYISDTAPDLKYCYLSRAFDEYNQYLFSRLIVFLGGIDYECLRHDKKEASSPIPSKLSLLGEVRRQLSKGPETFVRQGFAVMATEIFPKIAKRFSRKIVFVGTMYIPFRDQLKLQFSLGQIPYLHHGKKKRFQVEKYDARLREKLDLGKSDNEFEAFLNSFLPDMLPPDFLETYRESEKYALSLGPKKPKVIITAFSMHYRMCCEFWIAHNVEKNGTKFIISQHGGGYGISRNGSVDRHFHTICDHYCTWGSTLGGSENVEPMPSFRLYRMKHKLKEYNPSGQVLVLATTMPRYKVWAESGVAGVHMLNYLDEQKRFLGAVSGEIFPSLSWRYFNDLWEDVDRLKEEFPKLHFQHGLKKQLGKESDFIGEIKKSRLAIHTANETTYLETIASNFPTLVYWNPKFYEVRDDLKPYFDVLLDAGILHHTPESAAKKLNEIFDNVESWWWSDKVQDARRYFADHLAKISEHYLTDWRNKLNAIARQ